MVSKLYTAVTRSSGPEDNDNFKPGDELELDAKDAKPLLEAGVITEAEKKATKDAPESKGDNKK